MGNPAETYESYMVPALFGPWASPLIQSADPRPGERVLDLGCGTGIVARRIASRLRSNGRISALDLNPGMLAVARAVAEQEGLTIEWHEGSAEHLPFPDGSFDLVSCQFALMFFADRRAALAEVHRVLADGGRCALSVFQGLDRHPFYQTLDDAIQRRFDMSGVQEIFSLGDADELHAMLAEAGFERIEIEPVSMTARFPDPEAFLAGEIDVDTAAIPAMQHLDDRARRTVTAALRDEMDAALREVTEDNHVVIPFHVYIARAER